MQEIRYKPIGVIYSPFKEPKGMPIQPAGALGVKGTVQVFAQFCAGLKDLGGFPHIILVYHFHLSKRYSLEARPFLDQEPHGVFATRAPARPNPIGISVVRLVRVEDRILYVEDVDVVDGTPLLDIKPYIPDFGWREAERIGWLSGRSRNAGKKKADGRFQSG
jgi:tRNA-Thr(GGU) m(6)t(6)A37 methyltransferase TsaA